jgi:hypothetical protein
VQKTGSTETSITMSWSASTDNVGVNGYGVYRDGSPLSSITGTSYAFSGLACGTSYFISIDAYDAAGNRSVKASMTATTSACSASGASLFIASGGSDSNPCSKSAPCLSFDRAYHLAQAGQTVEVAGGSYSGQTLNVDSSKTSVSDVVFRPAAGASVTIAGLVVYGSHLTFQDFTLNGDWQTFYGTDDVTFRNLVVHGGIFTQSSSNISVIGGSVGGVVDTKPQFGVWPANTGNSNILVDGVTFHDMTRSNTSVHIECLLVAGVTGFTLRNSRFYNCDVFDVSIGTFNGGPQPRDILVENNFFSGAGSGGYYSLDFNDNTASFTNVTIRNNSATQEMYLGNAIATLTNVVVTGNVAPISPWACDSRIKYSYNVFLGAACGASDLNAPANFTNPATLDLHLKPGAAAIDHGNPTNFPSTDIDGKSRPRGTAPDAGANETG